MGLGKQIRGRFVLHEVGDNTQIWFWHVEIICQKMPIQNCFTLLLIEAQRW